MENVNELCISAFFTTPMQENMELFNNQFDQELSKVGDEIEKCELFNAYYDEELYNHCAMVETEFK